jgi:hypothetical protein
MCMAETIGLLMLMLNAALVIRAAFASQLIPAITRRILSHGAEDKFAAMAWKVRPL